VPKIGGSTGAATADDPEHDLVRALDRWVTQSVALTTPLSTRIVSNDVNSFSCAAP